MNEEMIKAPLDETNVSPTTIIDELTESENVTKENKTLGFIENCPVLFKYRSNIMRVIFVSCLDLGKCRKTIEDYIKQMCENTKGLVITAKFDEIPKGEILMQFYWDTKNK